MSIEQGAGVSDDDQVSPPAGWYDDPSGSGSKRYWDGHAWSVPSVDQRTDTQPVTSGVPAYPAARRTNGLAIAAFVLALLWLCGLGSLLGVIFGIVALSQIRQRNEGGTGFAITGLVLGSLGILGIALALVLGAAASDSVSESVQDENIRETRDAEVVSCVADESGQLGATIAVTNHSSKPSNYIIEVSFVSPGGAEQYDTSTVFVNGLEPNQRSQQNAVSFTDAPESFECRILSVERFAA